MKKYGVITGMCMGLLLYSSCGNRQTDDAEVPNVRLFTVESAGMMSGQDFPGRVKAAGEVNMAFKVSGTLMCVCVEDGSRVSKGQLIAEIDPRDYQTQLDAAEAEYMKVKAEAERVMALYTDSVSTADAYDKARYGLRQITAKYENARNQLNDTKLYAPFSGYVQKRLYDPPTVVAAGMPVAMLVSDGEQEIEINVPASTYIHRQEITSFSASFDFIPNRKIPLRLISVVPKANANQLYTMRLAIPSGLSPQPSPGMNALVTLSMQDAAGEKTYIPSSALFRKDGQSAVWVYETKGGTITRRNVVVERLDTSGNAIVSQGLAAGELVVTAGVHKLSDNQNVKPVAAESDTNVGGLL